MSVSERTRREVWVAAGGRCSYCKQPVDLGGDGSVVHFGEVAHIAGQGEGSRTPRRDPDRSPAEVDSFENLLLLCPNDHRQADGRLEEYYTEEALRELKRSHEAAVAFALDHAFGQTRALVCRLSGPVQGEDAAAPAREVIAAALRDGCLPTRTSRHDYLGQDRHLQHMDDQPLFRQAATQVLTEYAAAAHTAYDEGEFDIVALFAFADLPSLFHLGYLLNELPIRPFQRDPATGSWAWQVEDQTVNFEYDTSNLQQGANEIVLCMDISGTVDVAILPATIADLPIVHVAPADAAGHRNVIQSRADVDALRTALVQLLGILERDCSKPLTLHVVGPLPVSGAVVAGNALAHRGPQEIVLYDFDSRAYTEAVRL